jgi:diguanylate cyclase (GGDEF)-like protein
MLALVRVGSSSRRRLLVPEDVVPLLRWSIATLWNTLRLSAGLLLAASALSLCVAGVFRQPGEGLMAQGLALAGLCAVLVVRLFERAYPDNARTWQKDLELGSLCIAAAFVLVEMTGGPAGLLYPFVYALVAFLVAFHDAKLAAAFVALIVGVEVLIYWQDEGASARILISHGSFVLLFAALYTLFLRGEIAVHQVRLDEAVATHLKAIAHEARDFRLTSGLPLDGRVRDSNDLLARRRIGSVQAIQDSLYHVLAVAERALQPHTVALFWLQPGDQRLELKELRSSCDSINEQPLRAGEGVLGAILKRKSPLVLSGLDRGHNGLVYYTKATPVTDFVGVPVMEGPHPRGVLVADRIGRPFEASEVEILATMGQELMRAVQVEQIFAEMDQDKYRRERFYQTSSALNQALGLREVATASLESVVSLTHAPFAAMCLYEPERGTRTPIRTLAIVTAAAGVTPMALEVGLQEGLVGAAIKANHPLPHGSQRSRQQAVFSPEVDAAMELTHSFLKVFPLSWKNEAMGAIVVAGDADFLPPSTVDMLQVIVDHAAIATVNARMYEHMQRMATTDGLTGLVNHRHFQKLFEDQLRRAERFRRHCSLVLIDLDHFKSVNDTYGHPMGDKVLRRVAEILQATARKIDVVARYGGEEFALLLDETDAAGAGQTAERIRTAVEVETFQAHQGSFRCTLSMGIATYPQSAQSKASLLDCADQALYRAKKEGRNRVVTFRA